MSASKKAPEQPEIPEEVRDRARNFISQAFGLIGQQLDRLGKDLSRWQKVLSQIPLNA
jgi:hypothetical protein